MSDMIVIEDLSKTFKGTKALDGLNLRIEEGEVFGFIGPNGAGKTTTIRILSTLLTPTRGKAFIGGVDVIRQPEAAKKLFGYRVWHLDLSGRRSG